MTIQMTFARNWRNMCKWRTKWPPCLLIGQILMPNRTQYIIFCVESSSSEETPNTPLVLNAQVTLTLHSSQLSPSCNAIQHRNISVPSANNCCGFFSSRSQMPRRHRTSLPRQILSLPAAICRRGTAGMSIAAGGRWELAGTAHRTYRLESTRLFVGF